MWTPFDDDLEKLTTFEAAMHGYVARLNQLVTTLRKSASKTTFTGPAADRFRGDLAADLSKCSAAIENLRSISGSVMRNRTILEDKRDQYIRNKLLAKESS